MSSVVVGAWREGYVSISVMSPVSIDVAIEDDGSVDIDWDVPIEVARKMLSDLTQLFERLDSASPSPAAPEHTS